MPTTGLGGRQVRAVSVPTVRRTMGRVTAVPRSAVAGVHTLYRWQVGWQQDANSGDGFLTPGQISMARAGEHLYIASHTPMGRSGRVLRYTPANDELTVVAGPTLTAAGPLTGPAVDGPASRARFRAIGALEYDPGRNWLYIADVGDHRVRVLDLGSGVVSTLAGNGQFPANGNTWGIPLGAGATPALDALVPEPHGLVYDPGRDWLYIFGKGYIAKYRHSDQTISRSGGTETFSSFSERRSAHSGFVHPATGELWVTSGGHVSGGVNMGIYTYNPTSGAFTRVAGTVTGSGYDDGAPATARMSDPAGITLEPDGRYAVFADRGNHVIRRVDTAPGSTFGVVSTVWGERVQGTSRGIGLWGYRDGENRVAVP